MGIDVTWTGELAGLDSRAGDWDRLVQRSGWRMPTHTYPWVRSFFETRLGAGRSWRCGFACRGGELVGVLPLVRTGPVFPCIGMSGFETPFDEHTITGDVLSGRGDEVEVVVAFLEAIRETIPDCVNVRIRGLSEASPTFDLSKGRISGFVRIVEFRRNGSFVEIDGSFEDYLGSLSHNFRGNLRKARNKIGTTGPAEWTCLRGPGENEEAFKTFVELEASGWKGREGTAIAKSDGLVLFYSKLTRLLAERGWLEWHFLKVGTRTIAGQLGIRLGQTLFLVKIAYDEGYARCAPGNILFYGLLEKAFASRDTGEIDCMTDMGWHENWRMKKRRYYDMTVFPKRPVPLLCSYLPNVSLVAMKRAPGLRKAWRLLK